MTLVTASHTLPQVEGMTKAQLLKQVSRETGLGQNGVATSGSTTVIGDTGRLKSTQFDTREWVGGWGHIIKDAGGAGAAPEGQSSPITTYDPTHASDHITMNPALSAAVAAGDEYILWKNPAPKILDDLITDCLTQDLYIPAWTMLTEVPDGDMEQNNTTDWVASGASLSKLSTGIRMSGKRWLSVTASSNNGYAQSAALEVVPGKTYHASVMVRPFSATDSQLIVWDNDNSVALATLTTEFTAVQRLATTVIIPADCFSVSLRLLVKTDGNNSEWDEACFYCTSDNSIKAPWWIENKNQILGVLNLHTKNISAISPNIWDPALRGEPDLAYYPQDDAMSGGGLRLVNRHGPIGPKPIFLFGIRNEEAYANYNTEKKYIDDKLLVACVAYKIFNYLSSPLRTGGSTSKDVKERLVLWSNLYTRLQNQQMETLSRVMKPDDSWVQVNNEVGAGYRY